MMRQYELVERVQKYDPSANEALLNRAYVYAMLLTGGAAAQLKRLTPPGFTARIDVTLTDDFPQAQAVVLISGVPVTTGENDAG